MRTIEVEVVQPKTHSLANYGDKTRAPIAGVTVRETAGGSRSMKLFVDEAVKWSHPPLRPLGCPIRALDRPPGPSPSDRAIRLCVRIAIYMGIRLCHSTIRLFVSFASTSIDVCGGLGDCRPLGGHLLPQMVKTKKVSFL